jgi:hypothetical protein
MKRNLSKPILIKARVDLHDDLRAKIGFSGTSGQGHEYAVRPYIFVAVGSNTRDYGRPDYFPGEARLTAKQARRLAARLIGFADFIENTKTAHVRATDGSWVPL